MVCKIIFGSEFPVIPYKAGRKREEEEEEHRQLENVMRFTQTQKHKQRIQLCYGTDNQTK